MDVYQRRRLVALSILAGVFIVFVLLIRSCGGDEAETPVATTGATGTGGVTALSQADFVEQGDAACLETNTALAEVDQSDPVAAAAEEGQLLAGQLESLQTLPPPEDGTDKLTKYLSALQDQVTAYDSYITALERGDAAATELSAAIDEAAAEAEAAAKKFGFEVCGDPTQVGESSGGETTTAETDETGAATTPAPAPVTPEPAPVTPAPTDGGVAPPAPAPAPAPADDTGSGSGGVSP